MSAESQSKQQLSLQNIRGNLPTNKDANIVFSYEILCKNIFDRFESLNNFWTGFDAILVQ